jgi:DNA repair protein RecO (recombination protein O)
MATYQTQGIILKKADQGESDQLFSIYTVKKGKVRALGRGTKKIQSKLNSSLQQFSLVNLMIASGKNYDHVAGAQLVKNFSGIKKDLKKVILASFGLEVVDKLTKVDQPDTKIFTLLAKYLEAINDNSFTEEEWQIIKQAFVIKLLTLLGLRPKEDIITNTKKLDNFLKDHLDSELQTEKFLAKISQP